MSLQPRKYLSALGPIFFFFYLERAMSTAIAHGVEK
ncbi:hypothetical protein AWB79_01806 [Caballeronia hypogeia]|uniref:Uncharacterized protein n=1 Tax=Caballeronia hypogeia TaxID=1777140 RepID=A0A158A252_9BURK|nr:hypothetical protein AWB79_01806 [Caballeronia hypogeia]